MGDTNYRAEVPKKRKTQIKKQQVEKVPRTKKPTTTIKQKKENSSIAEINDIPTVAL